MGIIDLIEKIKEKKEAIAKERDELRELYDELGDMLDHITLTFGLKGLIGE